MEIHFRTSRKIPDRVTTITEMEMERKSLRRDSQKSQTSRKSSIRSHHTVQHQSGQTPQNFTKSTGMALPVLITSPNFSASSQVKNNQSANFFPSFNNCTTLSGKNVYKNEHIENYEIQKVSKWVAKNQDAIRRDLGSREVDSIIQIKKKMSKKQVLMHTRSNFEWVD